MRQRERSLSKTPASKGKRKKKTAAIEGRVLIGIVGFFFLRAVFPPLLLSFFPLSPRGDKHKSRFVASTSKFETEKRRGERKREREPERNEEIVFFSLSLARFLSLLSLLNLFTPSPDSTKKNKKTDDSLAIIAAFASPELEIIGLTTTFGNVHTPTATKNAFVLLDLLGVRVPVAQGALGPVDGGGRPHLRVASFVHGEDGLGNTEEERRRRREERSGGGGLGGDDEGGDGEGGGDGKGGSEGGNGTGGNNSGDPRFSPDPRSAAAFIADSARAHPGEVSVLALGPLTNVAEALLLLGRREREKEKEEDEKSKKNSSSSAAAAPLSRQQQQQEQQQQSHAGHQLHHTHPACSPAAAALFAEVVALGGAFFRNGNVTPAAEANVLADPAAADLVLSTPGLAVRMVGLDVTHSCRMTASELESLRGEKREQFFFVHSSSERRERFYTKGNGRSGGKKNSLLLSPCTPSHPLTPPSTNQHTGQGSRVGGFAADISRFYLQYHAGAYAMPDSMFLHDPTALAAVVAPHLFTWLEGPVVVCVGREEGASGSAGGGEDASSSGGAASGGGEAGGGLGLGLGGLGNPLRGMTVIDQGEKRWAAQKNSTSNAWVGRPPARVAVGCDSKAVVRLVLDRLTDAAVAGGG